MGIELKITAYSAEALQERIEAVLNLATIFTKGGKLPTTEDIKNRYTRGNWWTKDERENKYQIMQTSNSYKAFIRDKGDDQKDERKKHFIVLEFYYRYDREENGISFNKTMTELALLMLQEHGEILQGK